VPTRKKKLKPDSLAMHKQTSFKIPQDEVVVVGLNFNFGFEVKI
jgi:hypothetical protein